MKTNIDLSRPTEFREMCARIMGTLSGCVKPTMYESSQANKKTKKKKKNIYIYIYIYNI